MKRYWNLIQYLFYIGLILTVVGLIMDFILMPIYVRYGQAIILPDTQGMEIEEATKLLENRGFKVITKEPKFATTLEPGHVYEQTPAPLSRVKTGRRVYLTPSLEERLLTVPDIIGLSQRNAYMKIERTGFKIDSIFYDFSNKILEGAVIAQSIPANLEAKRGTPIWITVSLGPRPDNFTVPNLRGKSLVNAKQLIVKAGLKDGNISYRLEEDLIPFTIIWQSINPGIKLKERTAVDLIVSITDIDQIPDPPEIMDEL